MQQPLEAVAAYWLSLRKLVGGNRTLKPLEQEADFVAEPFARHLLALALSDLAPARFRQCASIGARAELMRLSRQIDFMRITVMDIAQGENPRRTLARMLALFAAPPENPEALLDKAQNTLKRALDRKATREEYLVDHRLSDAELCVVLLFYAVMARRHGKAAGRPFLPQVGSAYFADGLALVVDGFDLPFVRKWLKKYKETLLTDMDRKYALSMDMCEALRDRLPFEAMELLARSHIR